MSAATPITTTGNQSNKSAQKMKFAVESPAEICYDEVAVNEADSLKGDNPMRKSELKICALYERLSREDDDVQGQSNSITTQKQLLADYAKSQGFTNIRHYTDDGTSGVRFEREAWQELIADVEAGKIAQVLCKDMSRLGRDHVQVGLIMEIFRKADVRFIAVTNNIDSAYPETLEFAPFLNLVNEWYLLFCRGYFVCGILLQHGNRSVCSTSRHTRVAAKSRRKNRLIAHHNKGDSFLFDIELYYSPLANFTWESAIS